MSEFKRGQITAFSRELARANKRLLYLIEMSDFLVTSSLGESILREDEDVIEEIIRYFEEKELMDTIEPLKAESIEKLYRILEVLRVAKK